MSSRIFDYPNTCPDIDKQIRNFKYDLSDIVEEIMKELNPLFCETNDLKQQIKSLMEQLEKDRKMYNDNIILMETKKQINENINNKQINSIQKGGENIKFFDIRDKKAIGYFEKDIKLFNENNNDNKNKEPTNRYKGEKISYSTDYMVDLLKVSDKVKKNHSNNYNYNTIESQEKTDVFSGAPQNSETILKGDNNTLGTIQEIDILESDETDDTQEIKPCLISGAHQKNEDIFLGCEIVKKNNSIFMKNKPNEKYIDIKKMKIVNESVENNINDGINLKKELDDFIKNNNDVNSVVYVGGGKKNKIEIRQIDNKYKMKFDNVFSTLTEQNINLNDDKLIKKIRHRKYMRHNREKNKLADLQEEINF